MGKDSAAAREHYVDVGCVVAVWTFGLDLASQCLAFNRPSSLRKLQDSIANPKYDGVRTSRKALLEPDDPPEDEEQSQSEESGLRRSLANLDDEDESEEDFQGFGIGDQGPWGTEDESPDEGEDEDPDEEEEEEPEFNTKPVAVPSSGQETEDVEPSGDLTSTLKNAREADRRKGKAVRRQIVSVDFVSGRE